jgi:hypothetical protein
LILKSILEEKRPEIRRVDPNSTSADDRFVEKLEFCR